MLAKRPFRGCRRRVSQRECSEGPVRHAVLVAERLRVAALAVVARPACAVMDNGLVLGGPILVDPEMSRPVHVIGAVGWEIENRPQRAAAGVGLRRAAGTAEPRWETARTGTGGNATIGQMTCQG